MVPNQRSEPLEDVDRRRLSVAFIFYAALALAVILAGFMVPAGDDGAPEPIGETRRPVVTRPTAAEVYSALQARCADQLTWSPRLTRREPGNAWDSFTWVHSARMEVRYCEQWLGGQLLAKLLGLGPPGR